MTSGRSSARFVVGIDLGTTNSALAFVDTRAARRTIETLPITQLVSEGRVADLPTLPSCLYLAGEHDVAPGALALPWAEDRREVVGELARVQGARVPGRLVTSAKSWLTHAAVDRGAAILPWGAADDVPRLSPVAASARYLAHLRALWDHRHPDAPLAEQQLVLTVPASFDEVARELAVAAAREAGLADLTLLEEPQAAFYAWLAAHERRWEAELGGERTILVVDVGGGTTDFSLIACRTAGERLRLERLAVGDHLLLGGDNMDIALARRVEERIGAEAGKLDSVRWQTLVMQCRVAKERLLAGDADACTVQVPGRGRGVIAGAVAAEVTRVEVEALVRDGFFPVIDAAARPRATGGAGLREWGLPFASESEIPRHLAAFLARHGARIGTGDAVLFNGGVFTPAVLRARMVEILAAWAGGGAPAELPSVGLDDAVARGAAYYGLAARGAGVRVGAGAARACYLGLGPAADDAARERLLCLVPRGVEEGASVAVTEPEFEVLANQPVSFQLYTSTSRSGEAPGAIVAAPRADLATLPPIRTVLRHGRKLAARTIPVHVEVKRTALGTLELWCAAKESAHRWRLEFQLREAPLLASDEAAAAPSEAELAIGGEQRLAALAAIAAVFPPKDTPANVGDADPAGLPRALEGALGAGKDAWPLAVLRPLWDALWAGAASRARSAAHEARWLNLCGFLLRPGFGHEMDAWRVKQLGGPLAAGLAYPRAVQNRAEWWNLWKRVAGGLERGPQLRLHGEVAPWLLPRRAKKAKVKVGGSARPGTQEIREMWQAIGACERIDARLKVELGDVIVDDVVRGKAAPQQLWALARLGAREPLYGPLNTVVPAADVARWLDRILALPAWAEPGVLAFVLVQIARVVDDRERDLDGPLRDRLAARVADLPGGGRSRLLLHEAVPLDRAETGRLFDESLPTGLRVRTS
ncbi:MAG: Hsp70 family protein [Deltaproteobacteria bacterium]|nr:Hsp70 family protein [Deltaproteobacteria bacterium]